MSLRLASLAGFCALSACLLLARPASATTIIPVSDEDLVASSQVIVEGQCLRIRPEWNPTRTQIFTVVTFKVTNVIKGDLQPGKILLRQFGGQLSDGATVIWGTPYWQKGWEMLLFLNPDPDGGYRVAHLSLGYFRILNDPVNGSKSVVRSSPGPNVTILGSRPFERCEPKDSFIARIQSLVGNIAAPRVADARTRSRRLSAAPPRGDVPTSDFRFLSPGFRWFEPDNGERIRFRVNRSRAPNASGGVDEAVAAAAAWSGVPGSSLRVEIAGDTDDCGLRVDGTNSISFNDCTNRFDPPINCSGVVAIGGVAQAVTNQSVSIGGRSFSRITDADVIFNTGFDCILSNPTFLAEIMTHEMGHSLGFGHSSEQVDESSAILRDATLFLVAHFDGRAASLRTDDMDGARFLYRADPSSAPVAIVTEALPDAKIGTPFTFDLAATGSGPFTWTVIDGRLPSGLTISSSGRIAGTATAAGMESFTVSVRDGANFELSRALQLRSTDTPAPFVVSITFKSASQKLILTALNVDASATIAINGIQVVPPHTVKLKASKNQLIIKGSAADLNVRSGTANAVVVDIRGQSSNTFVF